MKTPHVHNKQYLRGNKCECGLTPQQPKPMKRKEVCDHCGGDLAIRNPKGYCDHLHYPENCKECEAQMEAENNDIKFFHYD